MEHGQNYSIRQMIELTGLSEFTIRGWENRYSAFNPDRSESGRRFYSKIDIERALLIRELLKRGQKISHIATLTKAKLNSLFEESQGKAIERCAPKASVRVTEISELVALQKWDELEETLNSLTYKNPSELIHDFLLPALQLLAMQVDKGELSISQEHIFSSLIKEKIYSSLQKFNNKSSASKAIARNRFVLATPEGDHHEIGLLMAHLLIRAYGFHSLYLGSHTPAQELSETALRFEARNILIVSTVSRRGGARKDLLSYVNDVQKRMGPDLNILLAGRQTPDLGRDSKTSLINLKNFNELEEFLRSLGGKL